MNHLKFKARQLYRFVMNRLASEIDNRDLERAAVVFAPHSDDETLGYGRTILKKKRAGAEVKIFFLTDGRKSHPYLISAEKLKRIRKSEAITVDQMLGLDENDVAFLEYKDGELSNHSHSAIKK